MEISKLLRCGRPRAIVISTEKSNFGEDSWRCGKESVVRSGQVWMIASMSWWSRRRNGPLTINDVSDKVPGLRMPNNGNSAESCESHANCNPLRSSVVALLIVLKSWYQCSFKPNRRGLRTVFWKPILKTSRTGNVVWGRRTVREVTTKSQYISRCLSASKMMVSRWLMGGFKDGTISRS